MSIYLCVKIHTKTNLKYFCKTAKQNPYTYKGSGIYWLRHINTYGTEYIKTLRVWEFDKAETASEFALKFSRDNKITESKHWANLQDENGLDGWVLGLKRPRQTGENNNAKRADVRKKISENNPMKRPEIAKKLGDSTRGTPKPWQVGENNVSKKPEVRDKIRQALTGVPKKRITCPHCDKTGGAGNMKRYHFDFCRRKSS